VGVFKRPRPALLVEYADPAGRTEALVTLLARPRAGPRRSTDPGPQAAVARGHETA